MITALHSIPAFTEVIFLPFIITLSLCSTIHSDKLMSLLFPLFLLASMCLIIYFKCSVCLTSRSYQNRICPQYHKRPSRVPGAETCDLIAAPEFTSMGKNCITGSYINTHLREDLGRLFQTLQTRM